MGRSNKAIVLVAEGLSPELLKRGCSENLLPGFSRLLREGASGPLRSDFVPYETPGLLTAFTGQPVADHGWHSYWRVHNADYTPQVLTSNDPRPRFLWERPELAHFKVGIVNICGTHPPKPVNGELITYPMYKTLHACYPRGLLSRLRRSGIRYVHDLLVWYSGQALTEFLPAALDADRARGDVAELLINEDTDLLVLNLTSIDRASHFYWQELTSGSTCPFADTAVVQAYRECDRIVAKLLDRIDDRTSLLLFSEVGFGPLNAYCSLNAHLASVGLLCWEDERASRIDWSRTRAFESVQGSHGVNINMRGDYAQGQVTPGEYEGLRSELIDALVKCINPYTGRALLRNAFRREEIYDGAAVQEASDIVLEPEDERYLPMGDPHWANHVNRTLQSGWHRRDSWWAAVGAEFPQKTAEQPASLLDIAPTCCTMLGVNVPCDLTGKLLQEAY